MGTSGVEAPFNSQAVEGHRMTSPSFELYREIPLTKGQVALVDEEDYAYLSQFSWHVNAAKECFGEFARME